MRERGARRLAFVMLAFWSTCLVLAQGALAASPRVREYTPELGVVLLVALAGRRHFGSLLAATYWIALARIAFGAEPPSAILAIYLTSALFLRSICSVVEVHGFFARTVIAGLAGGLASGWLAFVRDWHQAPSRLELAAVIDAPTAGGMAIGTAVAALFLGPLLGHLPGLSPLTGSPLGGRVSVHYGAPARYGRRER